MQRISQFTSLVICALPLVAALPDWVLPSWIGACWGIMLLAGLGVAWTERRLSWAIFAVSVAVLANYSLLSTTDWGPPAVRLIVVGLLACGWLMGLVLVPWRGGRRVPGLEPHVQQDQPQWRCSIWDIVCATAFVAMLCNTIPNGERQFDLICQIAPAFVGGIIASTLALQWAWRDNWSLASLASSVLCIPMLVLLTLTWLPAGQSAGSLAWWLFTGPLSVMAAQFIIVLLGAASVRRNREPAIFRFAKVVV